MDIKKHTIEYITALFLGLILAISIGISYGTGNQLTYLVDGLRMIDPDFLKYDWFATQTTHYHANFGGVLLVISQFISLPLGTVLVNVLLICLSIWALLVLLRHLNVNNPISTLLLLVALMILNQSTSVGQSYIYSAYLQPSSISSVFLIMAMVWFIRNNFGASGIFLLVSGLFHTNYLLLGLALFGLAHLLMGKQFFFKRTVLNIGPSCFYLIYLLPVLLASSTNELSEQARYIYQNIRSPHHYVPMTYLAGVVKYLGISLLGLAFIFNPASQNSPLRPLYLLFFSMFGIVTMATLLTTVVFVPFVSQLFPWRLAPFSDLLAEVLLAIHLVRMLNGDFTACRKTIITLCLGATLLLTYYLHKAGLHYLIAFSASLVVTVGSLLVLKKIKADTLSNTFKYIPVVVVLAVFLRAPGGYKKSNLLHIGANVYKATLFEWIQKKTPVDAQILIPPRFGDFRLNSQRAVVVDWKSPPIFPGEVMQWYQRISDVTGVDNITSSKQADAAYSAMDKLRIDAIKAKYDIGYAVFYNRDVLHKSLGKVVFENPKYLVIEVL